MLFVASKDTSSADLIQRPPVFPLDVRSELERRNTVVHVIVTTMVNCSAIILYRATRQTTTIQTKRTDTSGSSNTQTIMCCRSGCWNEPTTKDAYRLSWASLIITILAAYAGLSLYGVSFWMLRVATKTVGAHADGCTPFMLAGFTCLDYGASFSTLASQQWKSNE